MTRSDPVRSSRLPRSLLAAGCAKQETVADPARPVVLAQVVAGSGGETAVFAGEVKPRYESDLALPDRRQDRRARGRCRRARAARARCWRGSTRRTSACRRRRRSAQVAAAQTEYDFAQGRVRALPASPRAEVRQRLGARREAQCDEHQSREARAGEGEPRASRGTRPRYATLVAPEDGVITAVTAEAGQVVAAGAGRDAACARETEREVAIAVPEARIGELSQRDADPRRAGRRAGQAVSRAGARDLADGRSGDAHVRRAGVASPTRRRRCNGE